VGIQNLERILNQVLDGKVSGSLCQLGSKNRSDKFLCRFFLRLAGNTYQLGREAGKHVHLGTLYQPDRELERL
jgi:hypothetical protein